MKNKESNTIETPKAATPGAMSKASLAEHKKYKASRVRHASIREDGTFSFSFITNKPGSESGKSITRQCTRQVYDKVYGRHPGNNMEFTPQGGYAQTAGRTFYIYENPRTGIVDAISSGPGIYYNSRANAPVVLKDRRGIDAIIHPESGSLEVEFIRSPENEWQLPAIPGDLKAQEFERLLQKVDQATELYPGMQLTPEFMVSVVAGNRVTFTR